MRTEARVIEGGPAMRDRLAKRPEAHKYDYGHALILGGDIGRGGAARLAARAALRVGAGLVTVVCPRAALAENAARLDAVMLRGLSDMDDLVEHLADPRITAVCLGPGLGAGLGSGLDVDLNAVDETLAKVTACLGAERATVLDADALTAFADAPETLFAQLHEACVLTPHGGEFRRLFPDLAARLDAGELPKVAATREAAARAGCTVLFKGAETVIAAADGRAWVSDARGDRAAPWLATAGSGDVLAGLVAGLMARGLDPNEAAFSAAWLHVEAARSFGPGLIAEDLPEALPAVFRALGL